MMGDGPIASFECYLYQIFLIETILGGFQYPLMVIGLVPTLRAYQETIFFKKEVGCKTIVWKDLDPKEGCIGAYQVVF